MKTPLLLSRFTWASALCLGLLLPGAASAAGFARAGVMYVGYTEFDAETGFAVAGGLTWGAAQEHEVSLEIARAPWSWDQSFGGAGLGYTGEGDFTPILAGYRYYVGTAEARARFY